MTTPDESKKTEAPFYWCPPSFRKEGYAKAGIYQWTDRGLVYHGTTEEQFDE